VLGDVVDEVVGSNGVVHAPIGRRDDLQVVDSGFGDVERAFWPAPSEARRGHHEASSAAQLAELDWFPQPELLGRALIEQAKQSWVGRPRSVPALLPVVDHGGVHAERPLTHPDREGAQFADDVFQRPSPPQSLGQKSFVGLPLCGR
jgi:hypothetical protein